jgi:hypothetical protein
MKQLNLSPFIIVRAGSGPKDVGPKNREEMQLAASKQAKQITHSGTNYGPTRNEGLGLDLGVAQSEAMGTQASQRLQRKRNLDFCTLPAFASLFGVYPVWRLELERTDSARTGELEARACQPLRRSCPVVF